MPAADKTIRHFTLTGGGLHHTVPYVAEHLQLDVVMEYVDDAGRLVIMATAPHLSGQWYLVDGDLLLHELETRSKVLPSGKIFTWLQPKEQAC